MEIIDDLNSTIENLMKKEFGTPMPFDLSFAVPSRNFNPVSNTKPTVNFYLYDIRENTILRSNEPVIERRKDGTVSKKQPPARIQLYYCVTAWSPAQEDASGTKTREEHKQLSRALIALIKHPNIPSDVLSGDLIDQVPPLPTTVILPDGMENAGQFWSALDGLLKPFLDYRVTISLDFHKTVESKIVASKTSAYGHMVAVYKLAVRPSLRFEYLRGNKLKKVDIKKSPVSFFDSAAKTGDKQITVSNSGGLKKGDYIIIIAGKETEFLQIKNVSGNKISVKESLLYNHKKGSELKKLGPSTKKEDIKLATTASSKSTEIRVSGRDVHKLEIGDILKISDSRKAECFQVTRISGPELGLGDSESIIQFGGIVTNSAPTPAPIVGAKITLLNNQGIYLDGAISDLEGKYIFKRFKIGEGNHTLKAEAQGYKDFEKSIEEISRAKAEDFIFKMES
jgi:hypothetical protein